MHGYGVYQVCAKSDFPLIATFLNALDITGVPQLNISVVNVFFLLLANLLLRVNDCSKYYKSIAYISLQIYSSFVY